jgi:hypothetical protein
MDTNITKSSRKKTRREREQVMLNFCRMLAKYFWYFGEMKLGSTLGIFENI